MNRIRHCAVTLALAAALAGCAVEEETPQTTVTDTIPAPPYTDQTMPQDTVGGAPGQAQTGPRPQSKRVQVMAEGTPDTLEVRLVETPEGAPVGFSTYVPADMLVETDNTDLGMSMKFIANFGGVRNDNAYALFHFYPQGTSRNRARDQVDAFVDGLNPQIDRSSAIDEYPWAFYEVQTFYPYQDATMNGIVALGERDGRVFHFLVQYPAEYSEGMGRRVQLMLDELRWKDGARLR